jgi:hypothetical protein
MSVELTEALLSTASGWEVMKRARAYLEQGEVLSSFWKPPLLRGVVQAGDVSFRASPTFATANFNRTRTALLSDCPNLKVERGAHLGNGGLRHMLSFSPACSARLLESCRHVRPFLSRYGQSPGSAPVS